MGSLNRVGPENQSEPILNLLKKRSSGLRVRFVLLGLVKANFFINVFKILELLRKNFTTE